MNFFEASSQCEVQSAEFRKCVTLILYRHCDADFAPSYSRIVTPEATQRPDRIVRWEILNGLPGEGPMPYDFRVGHPTPWKEGFVVRFWNQNETECLGNFQSGYSGHSEVVLWPEGNAICV